MVGKIYEGILVNRVYRVTEGLIEDESECKLPGLLYEDDLLCLASEETLRHGRRNFF